MLTFLPINTEMGTEYLHDMFTFYVHYCPYTLWDDLLQEWIFINV